MAGLPIFRATRSLLMPYVPGTDEFRARADANNARIPTDMQSLLSTPPQDNPVMGGFLGGSIRPVGKLYHNTSKKFIESIRKEGMTAGAFSEKPIDFGGDVYLVVDKSRLSNAQVHDYGGVKAWEPKYETGVDANGFSIREAIPPEALSIYNPKTGKLTPLVKETK